MNRRKLNSKNPTIPAVNSPPHETPRGAAAGRNQQGASDNSQRLSVSLKCRFQVWRKNSAREIYCFSSALCFPLDQSFFWVMNIHPVLSGMLNNGDSRNRFAISLIGAASICADLAVYSNVPRASGYWMFFHAGKCQSLPICAGSELWFSRGWTVSGEMNGKNAGGDV